MNDKNNSEKTTWRRKLFTVVAVLVIPVTIYATSVSYTGWIKVGSEHDISASRSMAVGYTNSVVNADSMAVGRYLVVADGQCLVVGQYSLTSPGGPSHFIVGGGFGTEPGERKNLLEVRKDGQIVVSEPQGDISMGPYQ